MLPACYDHAMGALQVKNIPPDLHDAIRRRAAELSGVSTMHWLRALHALEDVGDGKTLRLADQRWRQLAPAFVGYLRLVQVAQLQPHAFAGGDVVAQRAVKAEDGP